MDWQTTFSLPNEHILKRNTLLKTLPTLAKEWKVTFDFKPTDYNYRGPAQVLQMTIGGKVGNIGDRTPALWMHKTRGVYIVTALSGKAAVGKYIKKKPSIDEWSKVEISQVKQGYKYMFSLVIKGETLWSVENTQPKEFSNVKVFASSDWHVAQAGSIRGLKIESKLPGTNKLLSEKY